MKIYLIFFLFLSACTSIDQKVYFVRENNLEYYKRENNIESERLREYIVVSLSRNIPIKNHPEIYLSDTLFHAWGYFSEMDKIGEKMDDSIFKEAILDLSNYHKKDIPINFSQFDSLKDISILPLNSCSDCGGYTYSLPGYSKDSTHLCFIYSYFCGSLCGEIGIIFLKKKGNEWIFIYKDIFEMS